MSSEVSPNGRAAAWKAVGGNVLWVRFPLLPPYFFINCDNSRNIDFYTLYEKYKINILRQKAIKIEK